MMSDKDRIVICDGVLGSWQRPTPLPSDTADQFAALFDHPSPNRKRRKRTLRDGDSLVSRARGAQR